MGRPTRKVQMLNLQLRKQKVKRAWTPFPRQLNRTPNFGRRNDPAQQLDLPFTETPWKKSAKKDVEGKTFDRWVSHKMLNPRHVPQITPIRCDFVKDDVVEILVGPDTGKQGQVRVIAHDKNQLKVIGCHHVEEFIPNMEDGRPGYTMMEAPLHFSEVKLVDPFTGCPTDVEWRFTETGEQVRVCTQSSRIIPQPFQDDLPEGFKYKHRSLAEDGPSDTPADVVNRYTYMPSLLLFHEEIMLEMNIPMTVPKKGLERRDLIMKELEEEVEQATMIDDDGGSEVAQVRGGLNTSTLQKLRDKVTASVFGWRK